MGLYLVHVHYSIWSYEDALSILCLGQPALPVVSGQDVWGYLPWTATPDQAQN